MPDDFAVTLSGDDAALRSLQRVRLDVLQHEIADILDDMGKDAATYPPELPNQRYQRTGDLGRGWTDSTPVFALQGSALTGVLENSVPYGPEVMGAQDQRTVFQGRWRVTDQIMAAWEARAAARVEDALGRIIGL